MTRSIFAVAPLTFLVVGIVLTASLQPRRAARAAGGGAVEVTQRIPVDGGTIERRMYIQPEYADQAIAEANAQGGVTAQFQVNPWKWSVSAMPVVIQVNTTLEAPRPPLLPAVQNAIDQWSSVSPTTFKFVMGQTTTAGPGLCDNDSHGNEDPHPDGVNTVTYLNLRPGYLGLTCTFQPDNTPGVQTEFDTELGYGINWGAGTLTADQYDLWSTVLHEMGHAAGMGHSCIGPSTCVGAHGDAVMNFALAKAQMKRVLTADDKAGLQSLYPLNGPTIPTPTPLPQFEHKYSIRAGAITRSQ